MIIKRTIFIVLIAFLFHSCASKKDILYFQDAKNYNMEEVTYEQGLLQPNDILSIIVGTAIPEAAIPYNRQSFGGNVFSIEALKLQGYLVSQENTINFPILGEIRTKGMTIDDLESHIKKLLEDGGHLIDPSVNARLLNAKFTVLGEVKIPGTFTFTEQAITLPQALGFAGDLTILGERKDIIVIREENGIRSISHLDLTSADWFKSKYYHIKPNDVIVVNPNPTKVKSAGFIGNAGIVLTIASLVLTSIVLITR